jgi:hypothetical protein
MFYVGHAGPLDAKVVNDRAKSDVTPHVRPKSRCVLTLMIASDGNAFLEEFVCEDASLWEPMHTLENFDIYPSIGINTLGEIVFVNYFLGNDIQP